MTQCLESPGLSDEKRLEKRLFRQKVARFHQICENSKVKNVSKFNNMSNNQEKRYWMHTNIAIAIIDTNLAKKCNNNYNTFAN